IMSGPGGHDAIPPTPEAGAFLVRAPGPTREERIAFGVESRRVFAGVQNPFDPEAERAKVERLYDRSYYPLGFGRQLVAILASTTRVPALKLVKVPTLVVHGADDPLVPPENGRRVAAAVPGARYLEFAGDRGPRVRGRAVADLHRLLLSLLSRGAAHSRVRAGCGGRDRDSHGRACRGPDPNSVPRARVSSDGHSPFGRWCRRRILAWH